MKISFVSTMRGWPWGGSEFLWSATAQRAIAEGHQVATITHRWPSAPDAIRNLQRLGARVFFRSRNRDRRIVRLVEQFIHPLPSILRWRPDVICYNQGWIYEVPLCMDLIRFQKKCGAPFVVVCQYNSDFDIPTPKIRKRAAPFFEQAHRVVFVSEHNRQALERQLALRLSNSCVLCNPVNLPTVDAVPWPGGPVVHLACVARMDARIKGQDILFETLSKPTWKNRPWRLRLYGQGKDRDYLQALAVHFGIAERVDFPGQVADLREVWADNHVLVLPSRAEGTPLALVEAMICGRPVVATDVGGNLDWIHEPGTGFAAEAPTVTSFGAALERAWQAREQWPAMGARAHEKACRKMDPSPEKTLLSLLVSSAQQRSKQNR